MQTPDMVTKTVQENEDYKNPEVLQETILNIQKEQPIAAHTSHLDELR